MAGDDARLGRALAEVGINESTEAFVLVAEKPRTMAEFLTRFGLEEDQSAYPRTLSAGSLDRLGIPEGDRAAVPAAAWEGLVLERVALVDLSSPKPGAAAARADSPGPARRKG